jgi:hypothetical protein
MPPTQHTPPTTATPRLALAGAERRQHKRFPIARPGKIFRRSTQQYAAIVTRNLSASGALLEIESERPFGPGELLDLAVAFRSQPVVSAASLTRAIVVHTRALGDRRQAVAVRYIQPEPIAAAA